MAVACCLALKNGGGRCRQLPVAGDLYCAFHGGKTVFDEPKEDVRDMTAAVILAHHPRCTALRIDAKHPNGECVCDVIAAAMKDETAPLAVALERLSRTGDWRCASGGMPCLCHRSVVRMAKIAKAALSAHEARARR